MPVIPAKSAMDVIDAELLGMTYEEQKKYLAEIIEHVDQCMDDIEIAERKEAKEHAA